MPKNVLRQLEAALNRPENAQLRPLYDESEDLFFFYLCVRHVLLFCFAALTLVGPFLLWKWLKDLSKRLVLGSMGPHDGGGDAAVSIY